MTRSSRLRLQVPTQGYGHEEDILRYLFFHSIALACLVGIMVTELTQLLNHLRRDSLRFPVLRSAMHQAMPHCGQHAAFDSLLNPIHQQVHCGRVVRYRHRPREAIGLVRPFIVKPFGRPTPSIIPSSIRTNDLSDSNKANLMLDEPPLTVRIEGLAGLADNSFR
jgi:hypothetical protein